MQEIPENAMTRMSKEPDETRSGNFRHSEKAELYPEFVLCDMGPSRNGVYLIRWMLKAVLLLAGNSP
jgi:hypothetical protein